MTTTERRNVAVDCELAVLMQVMKYSTHAITECNIAPFAFALTMAPG